jgi:hypothetical protein
VLLIIVLVLLVLMLFGSAPWYPYSRTWGYSPMSVVGLLLVLILVLWIAGAMPVFVVAR